MPMKWAKERDLGFETSALQGPQEFRPPSSDFIKNSLRWIKKMVLSPTTNYDNHVTLTRRFFQSLGLSKPSYSLTLNPKP